MGYYVDGDKPVLKRGKEMGYAFYKCIGGAILSWLMLTGAIVYEIYGLVSTEHVPSLAIILLIAVDAALVVNALTTSRIAHKFFLYYHISSKGITIKAPFLNNRLYLWQEFEAMEILEAIVHRCCEYPIIRCRMKGYVMNESTSELAAYSQQRIERFLRCKGNALIFAYDESLFNELQVYIPEARAVDGSKPRKMS